jgi:hypothetical protein
MLAFLCFSEDITMRLVNSNAASISVEPSGDWRFLFPVDPRGDTTPARPTPITSIEFSMSRSDLLLFTFSLPLYCGIALAAPISRACLRPLFFGAGVVILIELLSLLALIDITAHSVTVQMELGPTGFGAWPTELAEYLLIQVIPFAAPVVIAVASHRELRLRIFAHGPSRPVQHSFNDAGEERTENKTPLSRRAKNPHRTGRKIPPRLPPDQCGIRLRKNVLRLGPSQDRFGPIVASANAELESI